MPAERIVRAAKKWIGKNYKPGQNNRAADFVSRVLKDAGYPHYYTDYVPAAASWGHKIENRGDLKAGDLILWDQTFDALPPAGIGPEDTFTHIAVYIGGDKMIHRPAPDLPVQQTSVGEFAASAGVFNQGRRIWKMALEPVSYTVEYDDGRLEIVFLKDLHISKGESIILNWPVFQGTCEKMQAQPEKKDQKM